MRRVLKVLGWLVGIFVVLIGVLVVILWHSRPTGGVSGPEADALAREIGKAVNTDAWARTGAIRWTYSPGGLHHLWDKQRNFDRVRFGNHEVLVNIAKGTGHAYTDGKEVGGDEAKKLVEKGYRRFLNDSFWLNPLPKLFDDGVTRSIVQVDGQPALYVQYASGGVTPGDAYLWKLGDDHRPIWWRMFVQILHVKGLQATWEGWTTLSTGAVVATQHKIAGVKAVEMTDVAGAATLKELEPGPDPFSPLQ
jgi:hypothetical protein